MKYDKNMNGYSKIEKLENPAKINLKLKNLALNNPKKFWRIIAILCFFMTCGMLFFFIFLSPKTKLQTIFIMRHEVKIALSALSLICSIILIIKPTFLYVYTTVFSTWGLLYIIDGGNIAGFLLITLSMGFAYKAGSFSKHKTLDFILFFIPTFIASLCQLRFIKEIYIPTFIALFGYVIIILILLRLFSSEYERRSNEALKIQLDLRKFDLNDEQKELLRKVQRGMTYKEIGEKHNMSNSSVKHKLGEIYNIIGVENMQDFMRKYETAELLD